MSKSWLGIAAVCIVASLGTATATCTPESGAPAKAQDRVLPFAARSIPLSRQPEIVAVGEASHGEQAMLFARNRLISELAEAGRISWVALETGYAEARLLDRYVRGGPGTSSEVAAKGFTSGFGAMTGNIALLDDLRAINMHKPADMQIGIAGIDLSLAGPLGSAPTMAPVECALDGVPDPALHESLRASFSKAVIPGLTQTNVPEQAKTTFRTLSKQLTSSLGHGAPLYARQCASIVMQSAAVLDALPAMPADHSFPSDLWRTISARDEAMAKNALAILANAQGKNILLFAHTSHILNAPMLGGRWSGQSQPPQSMGEVLHRSLGNRYLAIVQIEAVTPAPSTPPSGLLQLLPPTGEEPCMVRASELLPQQVRIGINGNDQQLINSATAASFYLILPKHQ